MEWERNFICINNIFNIKGEFQCPVPIFLLRLKLKIMKIR